MKRTMITAVLVCVIAQAYAQITPPHQDPKYGPDSASRVECAGNLSTVDGFMKIDLIDRSVDAWKEAFSNCPEASLNIYIYGVKIMKYLIDKETDNAKKEGLIDTLMLVYDNRIKYFGQEGMVLGRKGIDLAKYRSAALVEAYGYLKKSAEISKKDAEEVTMLTFMKAAAILYKNEKIDAAEVLNDYVLIVNNISDGLKNPKSKDKTQKIMDNVDNILVESGAAECSKIVEIYTPKYTSTPNDINLLNTVTNLLQQIKCTDEKLYADAAESLYSLDPSSKAAYNLAKLFVSREDYEKAATYYKEAIDREEDNSAKADYYYQLGVLSCTKLGQYSQARSYAYEALKLKENWGMPYLLIGTAYAASSNSCGGNKFEKGAVFWAAVDKCMKAKSVDPSIEEEANKYIAQYSRYFPVNEDAFMYGFSDGQSYTVGCWINESTVVRTIKR
ncbi:MAG: tetratricopeptide repeat protein [Bacteroidales bacterium]|nr:tetratricopeptide repeat protein [Bacteroidales bacterium]